MTHISNIRTGDSLLCWMRSSAPLSSHRDAKGVFTYKVSLKTPSRFKPDHFVHYWGTVVNNFPAERVIELWVTPIRSPLKVTSEPVYTALVHYSTFSRVELVDAFSTPGSPTLPLDRPTKSTPLSGTNPQPYKAARMVDLR